MILIIDNYDSFTYNLYQVISQLHSDVKVIRNDQITIDEIEKLSPQGIVISPGPGKPEDAGKCIDIIRHFTDKTPIFGVCLGHQAIAVAFGGKVIKANQIVHGKSSVVFHNRSTIYKKLPLPFDAGRYHSLIIEKSSLPACLKVDSETADEIIMGIRHQTNPTFGVQFHPESILSDHGKDLIENFIAICKEQEAITC